MKDDGEMFGARRVLAAFAAVLALMYWRVLFGGETFYYRDFGVLGVPGARYLRDCFLAGELPLWNPYSNCGAPFLAQWGTMVLYPPSLLYVVLPFPWSLNFFCLLHLWLGAAGMYYLARRWTGSGGAAAVAGTAFLFNGITLAALTWPNYTVAVGLFPWVLYSVESAWDAQKKGRAIAVAALVSAGQILAGVPELALFTWAIISAFWIDRLIRSAVRGELWWRHGLIILAVTGLVAAQILPFLELLHISQRSPGYQAGKWALAPWGWGNLILPQFYTFRTPEGTTFQYGQEFLSSTYVGVPILFLALVGWIFDRAKRRWIFAGFGVIAAVLALGRAGYLFPFLQEIIPWVGIARYPVKFLYLLIFALPQLAAFGYASLEKLDPIVRRRMLVAGGVGATVSLLGLYGFNASHPLPYDRLGELKTFGLWRGAFALGFLALLARAPKKSCYLAAALGLAAADTATHLPRQNPVTASSIFAPLDWSAAHAQPKPTLGHGRVFITPEAEAHLLRTSVADPQKAMIGKRLAEWSHLNLIDRVPKVNGSSTLQIGAEAVVQKALYEDARIDREPWLDFLNTTLETASNSVVEWQERASPMPFVTGGQAAFEGSEDAMPLAPDFRKQVWLAGDSESASGKGSAESAAVQISDLKVSAHQVEFTAVAEKESWCVLAQTWHPAWKAEVNRDPTPVLKANGAFQAVRIPAGRSSVRVFYRDDWFRLGSAISLGTLLLLGVAWIRSNAR